MQKKRIHGLDTFRGFAIFLMIIYHFIYDLTDFGFIELKMNSTLSILIFRYTIITMFLFAVGVSLALVHGKTVNHYSLKKRILLLTLSAILVSATTYLLFPKHWIFFGILHCVLVSTLVTIPLLKYPKFNLILVPLIFFGWLTDHLNFHFLYLLLQEPLNLPTHFSLDRIPLFPWLSVILLGTLVTHYKIHHKIFNINILNKETKVHKLLKVMGRHSLVIYLIHQPIMFGAFYLYFKFASI
jgi:uncharacterized membrane protein